MRSCPAVIATLLLTLPASASAQFLDINQPLHNNQPFVDTRVGDLGTSSLFQQSFKPTTTDVTGGGFWWHSGSSWVLVCSGPGFTQPCAVHALTTATVEISLWSTLQTQVGSQPLARKTAFVDFTGLSGGWVDAFWDPIAVTPGQTYFLGVQAFFAPIMSGPGFSSNVYADGKPYGPYGLLDAPNGDQTFVGYYDYAFRTWTTAPEPSTYAMMAAGLLAVGVIARRRLRRMT